MAFDPVVNVYTIYHTSSAVLIHKYC